MTYQFAELNGVKLHYERRGTGQPLVLLHAGIAHLEMWADQMEAFTKRHQVIRYDLRGEGRSDNLSGPYTDHTDLLGLMTELDLDQAILLGASNGGKIALNFSLAYPERVQALILVAAALEGYEYQLVDEETEQKDAAIDDAFERGDIALAAELETQFWFDGLKRSPDQVDPRARARAFEMSAYTFGLPPRRGTKSLPKIPAIERLEEIQMPTLVIVGDQDLPDMQAIAGLLAKRIPNARKVIMPDAAHLPSMEKPEQFNKIVLDFLEDS